ncbi:pilus assembly PilX family protein [Psychromonas sp. PT13]|uniref:pilus assembly PilX family protein n=1 Tax=Psychromonas sp. PT13 TaxID=3439547 RepID=UPI003EBB863A
MTLKKQSGAILIVSLIILVALTLFVLSGGQNVMIQEKMTSAVRDMHVSLEIAESGIKDAESYIDTLSNLNSFSDSGNGGLYSEGNGPSDLFDDSTWDNNVISATTDVSDSSVVATYFIEDMGEVSFDEDSDSSITISSYGSTSDDSSSEVFKIVSRSTGISGNTERVIVSYYAKSF